MEWAACGFDLTLFCTLGAVLCSLVVVADSCVGDATSVTDGCFAIWPDESCFVAEVVVGWLAASCARCEGVGEVDHVSVVCE